MLRDHNPINLEEFNGLWMRGDEDSVPSDHFADCENIQYIESGFETRDGLDTLLARGEIIRLYNYRMQTGESLLLLDSSGNIYHALLDGSNTIYGPILSISGMTDFGFVSISGRAYITPFATFTDLNGIDYQKGLEDEFVYVYKGDGTDARKAAGDPPTNSDDAPFIAYNSSINGVVTPGIHVLAITFSNGADDSTALGTTVRPLIYAVANPINGNQIIVNHLSLGGAGITERRIWMTHAIDPALFDPNLSSYTYYLAKTVSDNTTLSTIVDIADADLTNAFVAGTLPNPTSGGLEVANSSSDGHCDLGLHVIGVVYETDTGYLTAPGPEILGVQTFVNENRSISVSNIPVSSDSFVTKRHLVASKKIENYNGDDRGFQLYFIPDGTIEDNTGTTLTVSFYDEELLDDASHLIDNFAEIPAGVTLNTYHGRLVLTTTFDDISIAYLSAPGEPEAIDQVDGIIIAPLDGNPLTNAQEYRDVLYLFKKTRTIAVNDNGDVPSTWVPVVLDQGIGASVHGIGTVLDSGGVNIDFILVADYSGIMVFNGAYQRPELTWKIQDLWTSFDRNNFDYFQLVNDSLNQLIYMNYQDGKILQGNYKNGLDAKNIRWTKWRFDISCNTIALIHTDTLVIGALEIL
jgi:hypothetical protein